MAETSNQGARMGSQAVGPSGEARERRGNWRSPFFSEVRVRERDEVYYHATSNLGVGGVFLNTSHPLPVGTHVVVELNVPASGVPPFCLSGIVAWFQEARPGVGGDAAAPIESGMGIAFELHTPEESELLAKLLTWQEHGVRAG